MPSHTTSNPSIHKSKNNTAQLTYLKRAWATAAENQDHSTGQARHPATNARRWSTPARLILLQARATNQSSLKKEKGKKKKEAERRI